MKHETFKHTLQDQKPGEPECLLFLTNGVEIRDSSEGVIGRKPDQATAAAPTAATGVGPCNPVKTDRKWTRRRLEAEAQLGPRESGSLVWSGTAPCRLSSNSGHRRLTQGYQDILSFLEMGK